MYIAEKISTLKLLLNLSESELPNDSTLNALLLFSGQEILNRLYGLYPNGVPAEATDVPPMYENIQIMACVIGYGMAGAEGQTTHNENGINRSFKYSDMIDYIHLNVRPYAVIL